jgi:type I restriction enzyme, S subunit
MIFNGTNYNCHWPTKELNELGHFSRGKSKHRPRNDKRLFECGKYPLIQTGEIKEANLYVTKYNASYNDFGLKQSKLWPQGTLAITIAANIAETAILAYPMCFPDSVVGFTSYPNETSELFMHYVFSYIKKRIQTSTASSIQDNINIDFLKTLKFKIPSRAIQSEIENLLETIDKKIEVNNDINRVLENMAQTIYNFWFVQLNFPNAEGQPFKFSGGVTEYNTVFRRHVPKGWSIKKLSDLGRFRNGINYNVNALAEREVRIVNVRDVSNSTYYLLQKDLDTVLLPAKEIEKYLVGQKDILVARSSSPGATRMLHDNTEDVIFSGFIINFTIDDIRLKNYVFHTIKRIEHAITNSMAGTIFKNVSQDYLKEIIVVVPDDNTLESFNERLKPITDTLYNKCLENVKLFEIRDSLLPLLINGQFKAKESEKP